jgi:hypothetical protein
MTREGRTSWLQKAAVAVEEAVAIYRGLGVQGDLAISLNNVSNRYSSLARLETTREGRASWLQKAVIAVEEAVVIRRELGVQGDLAMSLNNVSNSYSDLAGLETSREGRASWLQKAVIAVKEAVAISRQLGVQGDLAISLASLCRRLRARAEDPDNAESQLTDLRNSRDAIEEATGLLRVSGNMRFLLMSLQDLVIAYLLLANAGDSLNVNLVALLCDEGKQLAHSMELHDRIEFFDHVLNQLK